MRRPVLLTARVRLEPMTTEHLPLLVDLDSDAEVLRFLLGRARTEQEVREFWGPICADTAADAAGLGWWIGRRRDGGEFLGWWDLSPDLPVTERPARAEAGWRLARRYWRQGFATEGARALFDHGFATVGLPLIWAETMAVNQGSRAVMSRLGMTQVRSEDRTYPELVPGAEHGEVIYEITRAEWVG